MTNYQRCGRFVTSRIHELAQNPDRLSPTGRAALADLRRGVGKVPGSVPQIWQFTLNDPERPDGLSGEREEAAVHVALTHWAMHQQSKTRPMHTDSRTFGAALRLLASTQNRKDPQKAPVYRRMMALASSRALTGITTHARGLIGQLRATGIGFDYGRWADDLYWIQVPGRMPAVQRHWGQDFFRLHDDQIDAYLDTDPANTLDEGALS